MTVPISTVCFIYPLLAKMYILASRIEQTNIIELQMPEEILAHLDLQDLH